MSGDRGVRSTARLGWLAVLTVGVAAAAGCSSSSGGSPHNSSTPPPTPRSSSAAPSSSAPPASASGPLAGGVQYLRLYESEETAERQSVSAVNAAAQTKDVSAAAAAVRTFGGQERRFDAGLQHLTLAAGAQHDAKTLLASEQTLTSQIRKLTGDSSVASFSKDYGPFSSAAKSVHQEALAVAADLHVATDHPSAHLAPGSLPTVVAAGDRPFGSEHSRFGTAGYAGGGYRLAVTGTSGIVLEADRHRLHLGDTSVSATVRQTRTGTAYLTCRSNGSGTSTGRQYAFGVGSDGVWEIQLIDADKQQVTTLASDSSSAVHTGSTATNTVRADCVGHYLTLFVNGQPVYQVYDATLASGSVGVGVTTSSGPTQAIVTDYRASGSG